jgi:uncharacterized protein
MIQKSDFKPAWWLPDPHLQTLWSTFFRRKLKLPVMRERFELPDGDFVDLDWLGDNDKCIVLILHGLAGSIDSPYAQGMLNAVYQRGWKGVLMHFRGCSGTPNRLARYYHSGDTADLAQVVNAIQNRYPERPLAVVGYSLGGNVLLKWLGETKEQNPLAAAVAVSVPFELQKAAERVNCGFSRFYQWAILRDLKKVVIDKFEQTKIPPPITLKEMAKLRNFPDFDTKVTAALHGFKDSTDYYVKSSSRPYLKYIQVPTLILHALDDPFLTPALYFTEEELSPKLILELSDAGGHIGFIGGRNPLSPQYWLEKRIPDFLDETFNLD